MDVLQAVRQRRSIRRFEARPLPHGALVSMLEAARLSPSGANRQPLRFAIVTDSATRGRVFPHTHWARLVPDGSAGPSERTQPMGYFFLLADGPVSTMTECDAGAAAMSIMLTAESMGIASCWLASVDRKEIMDILGLDADRYTLHTAVALGYPAMQSKAVAMQDDSTAYYLEAPDMLCVPKRRAEDIAFWFE